MRLLRKRSAAFLGLTLAVVFIVAACGGDDDATATPRLAPTATTAPTTAPGGDTSSDLATLEIRVTDAPSLHIESIMLTIDQVEVNVATGDTEGGWVTVVDEPTTFDLLQLTGVEEVLGSTQLEPGRYNQIRLSISAAEADDDGQIIQLTLPSGKLRFVGSFDLTAGETTIVTVDIDPARSIVTRGGNQPPLLRPVVKLLVRKGGEPLSAAVEARGQGAGPAPTATTAPTATPTEAPSANQSATLEAVKDNSIWNVEAGDLSNGAGDGIFAGVTGQGIATRGLIAFDLTGIVPTGATITSASVQMAVTMSQSGNREVRLHRILADWGEAGSVGGGRGQGPGGPAQPGDATWLYRFFGEQQWENPGGDFVAGPSASITSDNAFTWESTSQLVADVQSWVDDPSSNFGWILIGEEDASRTAKRFGAREQFSSENRPMLIIEYTPAS
ncbi:MAG: DUF4382 domain-containing protein [Chloroflexi bacterium]|nr:DUF4382 domain-containing protein [Chloroflexota bacterium]